MFVFFNLSFLLIPLINKIKNPIFQRVHKSFRDPLFTTNGNPPKQVNNAIKVILFQPSN